VSVANTFDMAEILPTFSAPASIARAADVLQENVILRAVRGVPQQRLVHISQSRTPDDPINVQRDAPFERVVRPGDKQGFIHLVTDHDGPALAESMERLPCTLHELGLSVSTGRVVDFRAEQWLRAEPAAGAVPLIYPAHFDNGVIRWPKANSKKPNAVLHNIDSASLLVPGGWYVLVRRFSAKEERRRVVAAVFDPQAIPCEAVGFENHLNYFHERRKPLEPALAWGLSVFLNSTPLDSYFRQFNGHTQVNATDLRSLRYPARKTLISLGERLNGTPRTTRHRRVGGNNPQEALMANKRSRRIREAQAILTALGLPAEQRNERAALTLLALLDLTPNQSWDAAGDPLRGVTPIMEFAARHYGKRWKPNTRETVRRFTLHQFEQAGLVVVNPDQPDRPTNSPKYCYQIDPRALAVIQKFGSQEWDNVLRRYLADTQTLAQRYAQMRDMRRIPLDLGPGVKIKLSPGGQNALVEKIINEFCPRFTPGAKPVYVGDTDKKWACFDPDYLLALGVNVEEHGKMPDVVVHFTDKNRLVLIEAVTSHGPVNPKRLTELRALFAESNAGLVFVTAFLNPRGLLKYINEIAWETEVWVADDADHMIHFNGERFLGPY